MTESAIDPAELAALVHSLKLRAPQDAADKMRPAWLQIALLSAFVVTALVL